uniref:Uncharacterized protein n=1 Tax=Glossina pallidipes TaxID=7398 RepID=A0A1A9ZXU6_GLOPL
MEKGSSFLCSANDLCDNDNRDDDDDDCNELTWPLVVLAIQHSITHMLFITAIRHYKIPNAYQFNIVEDLAIESEDPKQDILKKICKINGNFDAVTLVSTSNALN